ncbi:hypothetical protein [Mycolicibacterium sediminis]|uniref:Uncharacterized protein n=1 Tax=Mycolicibacterium sediminis TaxID=1286180 RepID=A0A7I7QNU3_9MYCO|nr:hypothetical protein [Mycolicibacterium sediminis]BBY28069.1 hypothetical protein MSEDJ_21650 [Mycolicibacterium sediminis]
MTVPNPSASRAKSWLRDLDDDAWRWATWATPFVVQVVLGVGLTVSWVLGRPPFLVIGAVQIAIAAVTALLVSAVLAVLLVRSRSSRLHGLAVSLAGSCVVVAIGASVYGVWILGW